MDSFKWGKTKSVQKQNSGKLFISKPSVKSRITKPGELYARKLGFKALGMTAKVSVVIAVALLSALVAQAIHFNILNPSYNAKASENGTGVEVWWPNDGSAMSGSQQVKAVMKNAPQDSYKMYWQVDGDGMNEMYSSSQGAPHKENWIDFSGWNWKGTGPYVLTFTAKDLSGNILAQRNVSIYVGSGPSSLPVPTVAASTAASGNPFIVFQNDYPTLNGNYIDCYGNIDNDMAHHSMNPGDTDPGHRIGQNCPEGSMVANARNMPAETPTPTPSITPSAAPTPFPSAVTAPVPTPAWGNPTPTQGATENPSAGDNPLTGLEFFSNPYQPARQQADSIRSSNPSGAQALEKIASQPGAIWLGGWNWDVKGDVEKAVSSGKVPVFIAYNIPQRDCGGYSGGGVGSMNSYREWISKISQGLGGRKAVVVLEPDALSLNTCLSDADKQVRSSMLSEAVAKLKSAGALVYLDAGHPGWIPAPEMAARLKGAGVTKADGFALNVSNFVKTEDNVRYGEELSRLLNGKHFIVDTARNGNGPTWDYQWCNPSGRALGQKPTTNTGNRLVDAYLWLKTPGESDGNCNGGPNAGEFWTDYAIGLAQRANW